MAYKQIDEFVSERGLLDDFQSGFRKGHSTLTALIRIANDMREAMDNDCITLLVAIDHTRAFDLVNIKLFIDKLRYSGLLDAACNWIEYFLSGRSQVVAFDNGTISAPLERHAGLPQSSLLGPPPFSHSSLMTCLWPCNTANINFTPTTFSSFEEGGFMTPRISLDESTKTWRTSHAGRHSTVLRANPSKTQAIWVEKIHEPSQKRQ